MGWRGVGGVGHSGGAPSGGISSQLAGMHHRGRIQLLQITQLATKVSLKNSKKILSDFHFDAALFKI